MQRLLALHFLFFFLHTLSGCGYNSLQEKEEVVYKAWANIETNLQRRSDLIPNLVEVVKAYARHEQETFEIVIEARSKAAMIQLSPSDLSNPKALQQFQDAQSGLNSALSKLLLVVERYPTLKANENFKDLQNQLEGIENRINAARQRYNRAASDFNFSIRKLPERFTNSLFLNLERKEYFKAETK